MLELPAPVEIPCENNVNLPDACTNGEGKEGEGDQEAKGRNPGVHLAARRPAGAPRGLGPRVLGKYHYL